MLVTVTIFQPRNLGPCDSAVSRMLPGVHSKLEPLNSSLHFRVALKHLFRNRKNVGKQTFIIWNRNPGPRCETVQYNRRFFFLLQVDEEVDTRILVPLKRHPVA